MILWLLPLLQRLWPAFAALAVIGGLFLYAYRSGHTSATTRNEIINLRETNEVYESRGRADDAARDSESPVDELRQWRRPQSTK